MTEVKKEGGGNMRTDSGVSLTKPTGAELTVTNTQTPKAKAKKESTRLKGPWMYVGPTLPDIGIQNRVYAEIPEKILSKAKEIPEINLLFIPVKDYPMANRMLREKTGYLYHAYCKLAEKKKGGNLS